MNEFMLIFRNETMPDEKKMSPDQMQSWMKQWQDWMGSIAAQGKLSAAGNRLGNDGKVLKPGNVITDGPYVEIKEMLSGYIIVKAGSIKEAAELSTGCPILQVGGSVEIRNIMPMEM